VWIIGLAPACAAMLLVSKAKLQIERWAACVFALNLYGGVATLCLVLWPNPSPSIMYYGGSILAGGAAGMAEGFFSTAPILGGIFVCGLNLYALTSLLRQPQRAKNRVYFACIFMIAVGIPLSVFAWAKYYFSNPFGVYFWVFVVIAAVNALTLLRLRQIQSPKWKGNIKQDVHFDSGKGGLAL
jgi:hypothetical protein